MEIQEWSEDQDNLSNITHRSSCENIDQLNIVG